ncbi:hypothetical protein [Rhodanobacter terrae]|uniref:Uncharacterized protein n=1 Tax=Rhodanobacter terrae TaxID=418647 RepID=A0ABW0T166_9GAMM
MNRTRKPLRRTIDQQRVQVWYGWLRQLSKRSTAYALEKQLLPEGFARATDGSLSHRNRMVRYREGKHVPRSELVARAETRFPGGRALLEHPYWEILDPDRDVSVCAAAWLARLGADVQRLMYRPSRFVVDHVAKRRPITNVSLRQLENLGTFEALAATTLLLRETLQAGNSLRAHCCAASFWRLLLLIGSSVPFFDVLPAMAELADKALLHQVVHRGEQVALTSVPIRRYEGLLRGYCLAREDRGTMGPDHASWVRERLLLIRGKKGFDVQHAFRVPVIATPALQADPEMYANFLQDQMVRRMALDYCTKARWAHRVFIDDLMAFYNDPEGHWPAVDSVVKPLIPRPDRADSQRAIA